METVDWLVLFSWWWANDLWW